MKKYASMDTERKKLLALIKEAMSLHDKLDELITTFPDKEVVCDGLEKGCDALVALSADMGDLIGVSTQ